MLPDPPGTIEVDRYHIFRSWEQFDLAPEILVRSITADNPKICCYDQVPAPVVVSLGIVDSFLSLRGMSALVLMGDFIAHIGTEVLPQRIVLEDEWCTNIIQPWNRMFLVWEDPLIIRKFFIWMFAAAFHLRNPQVDPGYRLWKPGWQTITYKRGSQCYRILASVIQCAQKNIYLAQDGKHFTATAVDNGKPSDLLSKLEAAFDTGTLSSDLLGIRHFSSPEEYQQYVRQSIEMAQKRPDRMLNSDFVEAITTDSTEKLWKDAMKQLGLRSAQEALSP